MKIGQVAEQIGVSTATIRYYESIGLLAEPDRTAAGYRDYDDIAVDRLRFVRDAQATGLSLVEIGSVLEMKSAGARTCSHTTALLQRHLDELDTQIERLVGGPSRAGGAGRTGPLARPRGLHRPQPLPGDHPERRVNSQVSQISP